MNFDASTDATGREKSDPQGLPRTGNEKRPLRDTRQSLNPHLHPVLSQSSYPLPRPLSDFTTFRIGGVPGSLIDCDSESALVQVVTDSDAGNDRSPNSLLVLGGGSNLLIADEPSIGTFVRDTRQDIRVVDDYACGGVTLTVTAGTTWDDLVARSVEEGWSGLEALSGIPGTVGAAPVQNIGAYGREVAENLAAVRVLDRLTGQVRTLARISLKLGYRDSVLKQSLTDHEAGGGRTWGPTGRWVVLSVDFQLQPGDMSAPIRYRELAELLGVEQGRRAPAKEVREAVLQLRRSKGMVLDFGDHDTWSAGSFFTNPILSVQEAEELLPEDAPKFGVENRSLVSLATPNRKVPMVPGVVKTSAAWLISRAGFKKGFKVSPHARASLSTKHVLALTNRGGASAGDVVELAQAVRDGVLGKFGVELHPEPVLVDVVI